MGEVSSFPGASLERCPRCRDYMCLHFVSGDKIKECHSCDKNRLNKLDKILRHRS